MGNRARVLFLRCLASGAAAALFACRPQAAPDRDAPRTAVPGPEAVSSIAPSAPRAEPMSEPPKGQGASPERPPSTPQRFVFDFEDADLPSLTRLVGNITGKRFILTGQLPAVRATVRSPAPVTADEAYEAFLSILQANGLTVVPSGDFWKIMPSPGR